MLPVSNLVMSRLDLEPHALEHIDDCAARIFAEIRRRQIEIRADIVRNRRRLVVRPGFEHEELGFHPRVHRIAQLRRSADHFLENASRVSSERAAVRSIDVADHPGDAAVFIAPREDLEGAEVRGEQHVGLFDPNKAFD